MKTLNSCIILSIIAALCIFGVFHLIFPEYSALMIWCTITGVLAVCSAIGTGYLVTSDDNFDIKNSATVWTLTTASFCFFVWSLIYAFIVCDYKDSLQKLNGLYIGYLVLLIISAVVFVISNRGGAYAQERSEIIQEKLMSKQEVISKLSSHLAKVESMLDDSQINEIKEYKMCIDRLRRLPANRFSQRNFNAPIDEVTEAILSNDADKTIQAIKRLNIMLK